MRMRDATRRSGVAIAADRTVQAAAQIMEQADVGALAIVDQHQQLVGILTDRDIVRRAVGRAKGPSTPVSEIMTAPVVTISAQAELHDAYAVFRTHKLRRLAIVDEDRFVGMISVDDLLLDLSSDLTDLARPIRSEVFKTLLVEA